PIGSFSIAAGSGLSLGKSIFTNNSALNFSGIPITLTSAVTLSTRNAQTTGGASPGANITLGTVNGAQNLTLNAGSGAILFMNAVRASPALSTLLLQDAASVTASSAINAATFTQMNVTGAATYGGLVTATTLSLSGTTLAMNGGFTS